MKNKKLILGLSIGSIIAMSLSVTSFLLIKNTTNNNSNIQTEVITQQKIKITSIKYSDVNYGRKTIHYTINPKLNTDEVNYSLKYADDTDIESYIFSVSFKPIDNYITITCLKPFTKQIVLSIYAKSNENIKASINIDFLEKITLNPELEVKDNSPLSIKSNLTSTGGSITIDKTIKNESISFDETFVNTIKSKLKDRFEAIHYSNPQTTTYDQLSAKFVGLEQTDCNKLFTNNFTYGEFIESIYYEVEYTWIESDSDYEEHVHAYFYVSELLKDDFYTIFDGQTAVFSYSCEVNNQTYSKQLGLLIGDINITNISITTPNVIF
jgi:hypothetical protein